MSLRTVKRQKARDEARKAGVEATALSGRTNQEVTLQNRVAKALDQHLDRHKIEPK